MTIQLNRPIAYTQSWKATFLIGFILALVFSFILIFLQPFDTYGNQMPYKELKLIGYAIPIISAVLIIHVFEDYWQKKQQKWMLYNEIITMILGTLVITSFAFIYLNHVVNTVALPWSQYFSWFKSFGLPFAPLILGLWLYLRFKFSSVSFSSKQVEDTLITVRGSNANETYQFQWSAFIAANSQSNYIEIYLNEDTTVDAKKIIIRSTLSRLIDQLPEAVQVHRSFIINKEKVVKLEGNSRKGWCYLEGLETKVPVSPKHFKALKIMLQSRP